MKNYKSVAIACVVASFLAAPQSATAGGLFGDGGLIRGTVGEIFNEVIEEPILTPLARTTTVAAGTAAGTIVGGHAGHPAIGGLIGNQLGHCVNDVFAGGNCGTRTAGPAARPTPQVIQQQPQYLPQPQIVTQPRPPFGTFCQTPFGIFGPGPMNPVGAPCYTMSMHGPIHGRVIN